jgi:NADH dehydrogenase FAD-containing subunit
VRLEGDSIDAGTVVLTAGIVPSAVASAVPVVHDQRGRIAVDPGRAGGDEDGR